MLIISRINLKDTDLYTVNSYKYLKSVGVEIWAYVPNSQTISIKELEKCIPILFREKENLVKEEKRILQQ